MTSCPKDLGCGILTSVLNNGKLLGTLKGSSSDAFVCVYNKKKSGDRCFKSTPREFHDILEDCERGDGESKDRKLLDMISSKSFSKGRQISDDKA